MQVKSSFINELYVAFHLPKKWNGHTVFYVHGGPGSHSRDFEEGISIIPELAFSGYAFFSYDQRGSGRSFQLLNSYKGTHKKNINDLGILIESSCAFFNLPTLPTLYGHSYGARLVYDFLWLNSKSKFDAVISGTSIHPFDSLNTSLFIDLMILRDNLPLNYHKALKLISDFKGEPYELAPQIRKFFQDKEKRQQDRKKYYWANEAVMNWWDSFNKTSEVKDSDDVYFQVVSSFQDETFNSGSFDPSLLEQRCLIINGFHDFLMNGTSQPRIANPLSVVRFNGSAHYPHFEQPDLFIQVLNNLIIGNKMK